EGPDIVGGADRLAQPEDEGQGVDLGAHDRGLTGSEAVEHLAGMVRDEGSLHLPERRCDLCIHDAILWADKATRATDRALSTRWCHSSCSCVRPSGERRQPRP